MEKYTGIFEAENRGEQSIISILQSGYVSMKYIYCRVLFRMWEFVQRRFLSTLFLVLLLRAIYASRRHPQWRELRTVAAGKPERANYNLNNCKVTKNDAE